MKKTGQTILTYVVLSILLPVSLSMASIPKEQKEVESHLMCMCKDNCGRVLESCVCQYSDQYRTDIAMKLKEGLTKDEVIQTYVDRYGEIALSAPTKEGFNLTAWITPFFALFLGGFGIRSVITKWVGSREEENQVEAASSETAKKDGRYADLLKKELEEFDE